MCFVNGKQYLSIWPLATSDKHTRSCPQPHSHPPPIALADRLIDDRKKDLDDLQNNITKHKDNDIGAISRQGPPAPKGRGITQASPKAASAGPHRKQVRSAWSAIGRCTTPHVVQAFQGRPLWQGRRRKWAL
jgi:hypothetical protein